jgi:hypothetical protein
MRAGPSRSQRPHNFSRSSHDYPPDFLAVSQEVLKESREMGTESIIRIERGQSESADMRHHTLPTLKIDANSSNSSSARTTFIGARDTRGNQKSIRQFANYVIVGQCAREFRYTMLKYLIDHIANYSLVIFRRYQLCPDVRLSLL